MQRVKMREIENTNNIGTKHYSAAEQARTHHQQHQHQQQQTEGGSYVTDKLVCFLEFQLLGAEPLADMHPLIPTLSVEVALQTLTDYNRDRFLTFSARLYFQSYQRTWQRPHCVHERRRRAVALGHDSRVIPRRSRRAPFSLPASLIVLPLRAKNSSPFFFK